MKHETLFAALGEIDEDFIARAHEETASNGHSFHLLRRAILAAALLAGLILALSLVVFGSPKWLSLRSRSAVLLADAARVQSDGYRINAAAELVLTEPEAGNLCGFRLVGAADALQADDLSTTLREYLEVRPQFSGAQLPEDLAEALVACQLDYPDGETVQIRMLERTELGYRNLISQYPVELVREGMLQGMEAVWLQSENAVTGLYYLFCRSPELRCVVTLCSTQGFARLEAAAEGLRFVDTGIGIPRAETKTVYALRCPTLPEDVKLGRSVTEAAALDRAVLKDRDRDLGKLFWFLNLYSAQKAEETLHFTVVTTTPHFRDDSGKVPSGTLTVNERIAHWYQTSANGYELWVPYAEYGCWVWVTSTRTSMYGRGQLPVFFDPEKMGQIAATLELVPIELTEEAPMELMSLAAVG